MTTDPQATFVVEYPCDLFCRIELELTGERGDLTVRQLRDKADDQHRLIHEPEPADPPATVPPAIRRPAATLFQSAPGTVSSGDDDRRRGPRARPRR